jgi:glycerophosphoryl diester phosphodiesterase
VKEGTKSSDMIKIRLHYFLALILLLHCSFHFAYWISIGFLKVEVDQYLADLTGLTLPFTTILIALTSMLGIWSLFRFLGLRRSVRKGNWTPDAKNWIFLGSSIFFLALFYLSFIYILREHPSQKGVIVQLLNLARLVTDPLLFLIAAIWLRRLILFLRGKAIAAKKPLPWGIAIGLVLLTLVAMWILPAIKPPNWAYQGTLPARPALIAHRGASMLAPENTLAAAELAAENDAFGFETDIQISLDGIPFLMHDETLMRTTNILEVYPTRASDHASSFSMDELSLLNAGLWFIQKDPFNTIDSGLVSQSQLSINQGQKIPTLAQTLDLIKEETLVILFDLRYPPEDHLFYNQFFEIVFEQCKESGVNGNIWFLVDEEKLEILSSEAPQMTRVAGVSSTALPKPEALIDLEYEIVNVDTGILKSEIQAYRKEGLGVNVYTIDEPWLFSQFWLSGVTSVTTNNIHTFSQIDRPLLNLPYNRFLLFWSLFGIIVAIWLASSRPDTKEEPEEPKKILTPDLLDFAMDEDDDMEKNQIKRDVNNFDFFLDGDAELDLNKDVELSAVEDQQEKDG